MARNHPMHKGRVCNQSGISILLSLRSGFGANIDHVSLSRILILLLRSRSGVYGVDSLHQRFRSKTIDSNPLDAHKMPCKTTE